MKLKNPVSVLFVRDIEISRKFWVEVMKQEITIDFGANIVFKSGIALWQINENHIIHSGSQNILGKENRFELCFETEDIEKAYQHLKSHKVKFLHELQEEMWGQQTIRFYDPDNHLVEIGETMDQFVLRFYKEGMSIQQVSERTYMPVAEVERIINHELQILPAESSDLPAILKLQKQCFVSEALLADDFSIPPLTQDMASITEEFAKAFFLKGVINKQIVASVRGFMDNGICYCGRLIVHQDSQNQGIGRKMMQALEAQFPACDRYEIFTGEKSLKNLHLYKALGYKEFKRKWLTDKVTLVFLEKTNSNKDVIG